MFFNIDAKRKTEPVGRPSIVSYGLPTAGVKVDGDTALTYSAFWACVKIISETVGYLPWRIMEEGALRTVAIDHPLDRVVHRLPNPEMSSVTFKELLLAHCLTWGNAYCEIERNRIGDVVALWPIDPDNVKVDRDANGALVYEIMSGAGTKTIMAPRDIFHVRGPSRDGINGYSVVQMARESISLGLATESFGSAFFGNGAIPGMVIQNKGGAKLNVEGVQNLLRTWNKQHKGPKKAGKVEYLDAGMEVQQLGIPPADSQFLETRKFQITEIARWFRIPPHKLADLERSTHTNIESQNIEFVTDSIMPWVARIECQADISLLRDDEVGRYYNKINLKGLLRGDSKARAEYYKVMSGLGVLSIDEIRALEDQDELGGAAGALRMVPMNMTTVERMASGQVNSTSNEIRGLVLESAERFCKREIKATEKAHEKADPAAFIRDFYVGHAQACADGFRRIARIVCGDGVDVDGILVRFFGDYAAKSADQLHNAIITGKKQALFSSWQARKAENLARDLMNTLVKEGGAHV